MKINYDASLYKKIANFEINKIVRVKNRNGIESIIHIENIMDLSWEDLQLLTQSGSDKFSKRVYLYKKYSSPNNINPKNEPELEEIKKCIEIYHSNDFKEHHQINNFISKNNLWYQFPTIRSLNDHGPYKEIEGIQPKYFAIICKILKISGGNGLPLDSYKKY